MPPLLALARRDFLKVGVGAAIGLGFRNVNAAERSGTGKVKSVILVNLTGGLSHIDTLDMKPEALSKFAGSSSPRRRRSPVYKSASTCRNSQHG